MAFSLYTSAEHPCHRPGPAGWHKSISSAGGETKQGEFMSLTTQPIISFEIIYLLPQSELQLPNGCTDMMIKSEF